MATKYFREFVAPSLILCCKEICVNGCKCGVKEECILPMINNKVNLSLGGQGIQILPKNNKVNWLPNRIMIEHSIYSALLSIFGFSSLFKFLSGLFALNVVLLFGIRDILNWCFHVNRVVIFIFVEALVFLNAFAIRLLYRRAPLGPKSLVETSTDPIYNSMNVLKVRAIHELFWSQKGVALNRSSRSTVSLFAPLVDPFTSPTLNHPNSNYNTNPISSNRNLLPNASNIGSISGLASRLNDIQSPLQMPSVSQFDGQVYAKDTDEGLPVSRSKSIFSRSFFKPAKKYSNDNESLVSNDIEIISMSRDNKQYL